MQPGSNPYISTVARPHPARLDATAYPVRDSIQARFGDMDANNHLNNVALESLHENTRASLNRQTFPEIYNRAARTIRIVTSTIVVHYLREAPWPSVIGTGIGVGHIGRTSFVASTGLFLGDDCISLCDTVLVLLGDDGPTPIPDDARARLTDLQLQIH
ncbi:acyl-CoA thioesterase [Mycobacterium sp. pV006]|uniref:acyl-CoA thioesterase n=1 Tax=Mycobacterium sp. pV006 TaxID=3238983 RepID=UPI00351BCE3D